MHCGIVCIKNSGRGIGREGGRHMGNEKNNITHGYARCSTSEEKQDIDRQVRELKAAGAQKIWLEYEHGDAASKEQQALMLETAKPGDTIITLEVPRLARSVKQLCDIIDIVRDKHLRLIIQAVSRWTAAPIIRIR